MLMKTVISDMESRMYAETGARSTSIWKISRRSRFCLCEYMHDMGNSLGGMKSYIDLLDQYEDVSGRIYLGLYRSGNPRGRMK